MKNITSEIDRYITVQNEKIWNKLKQNYTFLLFHDPNEFSWKVKVEGNLTTIVTPNLDMNTASFTHELLHVFLDYQGMSKYSELMPIITGTDSFNVLIKNNLLSHLYNVCSHKKMFPYYKEMGFSEYDFLNKRISFNNEYLSLIKQYLNNKKFKSLAINEFIGQSLALLNNVVEEDNNKVLAFLNAIKELDYELFMIIKRFDRNWNNLDDLNLTKVFSSFEIELDNWIKNQSSEI